MWVADPRTGGLMMASSEHLAAVENERLDLFRQVTALCAASVRSFFRDMRDCHSAAAALKGELRENHGCWDVTVLGCSVLVGKLLAEFSGGTGRIERTPDPAHSVVLVSGFLIDPTVGQFRAQGISVPDYLILPPSVASRMLEMNNRSIDEDSGQLFTHFDASQNFRIAYIPTEPKKAA